MTQLEAVRKEADEAQLFGALFENNQNQVQLKFSKFRENSKQILEKYFSKFITSQNSYIKIKFNHCSDKQLFVKAHYQL